MMKWSREIKKPLYISLMVFIAGVVIIAYQLKTFHQLSGLGALVLISGIYAVIQMLVFYRDPKRSTTAAQEFMVSPADGRVVAIEETEEREHIKGKAIRVAIFMHVANVHIQRMPIEATFLWQKHKPGKYLPAFDPNAAKFNEQRWFAFERKGEFFSLVQIAGLLARRTICWLKEEKHIIRRNDKIGMITLGSEIDLYLPRHVSINVKRGDKVRAGETIIGQWQGGA